MRSIRHTSKTIIVQYDNIEEFKTINNTVSRYLLACLTWNNQCQSAWSYIYPDTQIVKINNEVYIQNLLVFSSVNNISCLHKQLKIYYTENGGYYAKTRFGRAWLNSFFDLPRDGSYERILTTQHIIKKEYLKGGEKNVFKNHSK